MNSTDSKTPKTDALARNLGRDNSPEFDLLRDIEREATALRADLDVLRINLNAEQVHSEHMRKQNTALRADRDALAVALRSVTRCLEWHEQRHGVGMDKISILKAHEAIAAHGGKP